MASSVIVVLNHVVMMHTLDVPLHNKSIGLAQSYLEPLASLADAGAPKGALRRREPINSC